MLVRAHKQSHLFRLRQQDGLPTHLLVNAKAEIELELTQGEVSLWKLLRNAHTIDEVIVIHYHETGQFQPDYITKLLNNWLQLGFIEQIDARPRATKDIFLTLDRLFLGEIVFSKFDHLFTRFYRFFLQKIIEHQLFPAILVVFWVLGIVNLISIPLTSLQLANFSPWTVLFLALITLTLHELGHAIVMKYVRAPILQAGFQLFLGLPVFFVDTTAVWIKAKLARVISAAGGVAMNLTIISLLAIGNSLTNDTNVELWISLLIKINLLQAVLSLTPFVRMDGYYILIDLIGDPLLEEHANSYAKQLLHAKKRRAILHNKGKYYLLFWGLSVVTTVYFTLYAIDFWSSLFAS